MLLMASSFLSFKVKFPCSNSKTECEALIIGLISILQALCVKRFQDEAREQRICASRNCSCILSDYCRVVDKIFLDYLV